MATETVKSHAVLRFLESTFRLRVSRRLFLRDLFLKNWIYRIFG